MSRQVKHTGSKPNTIKHIKMSSTILTKEMQIKTVRCPFTLTRLTDILKLVIPRIHEDGVNRSSHICW